ncbi:uncharacterized protein LOC108818111 [Raphanus sativus]|nr:uncharacterized protein LOC108818111 [Raphanus sativus]XP_056847256.1 uncharacterized protein LOC130497981 [Raphanus sativus]XP_056856022.1 uncharacterized protein LOC108818111 [Raphanus sativus]XP_056856023.1 uncharacterized protein LOC108818111 [Raphanus sativus]XP_056856024.1 uncharacterized protein LOC108818111 [Raphanus sativus]XP_056856026.1 uncharacterized protein LOC108818111 [Raphanus sativus]
MMRKFDESAARLKRRDGSVSGFIGGDNGSYGSYGGGGYGDSRGSESYGGYGCNANMYRSSSLAASVASDHSVVVEESRSSFENDSAVLLEYLNGGLQKFLASRRSAMNDTQSMISGKEKLASRVIDGDLRKNEAPTSTTLYPQVSLQNQEQNRKDSQLGYRAGVLNVESSDHIIKNAEMHVFEGLPMFDGANPESWIVKADRFFSHYEDDAKLDLIFLYLEGAARRWFYWVRRRTKFKDWSDFKCRLLARFASVPSCSLVDTDSGAGSVASNFVVHEPYLARNTTSPTMEVVFMRSGDCLADKKAEEKLDNDSLEEREQKTVAESEISNTDDMEKAIKDCCLDDDQETERFSVEMELKDDSTSDVESIHETEAEKVQELPSLTTEVIKKKKLKYPKAWKFKFKDRNFMRFMLRRWVIHETGSELPDGYAVAVTRTVMAGTVFYEVELDAVLEGSIGVKLQREDDVCSDPTRLLSISPKRKSNKDGWFKFKYKKINMLQQDRGKFMQSRSKLRWLWWRYREYPNMEAWSQSLRTWAAREDVSKLDFAKKLEFEDLYLSWLWYKCLMRHDSRSWMSFTHLLNFQVKHKWRFKRRGQTRSDQMHLFRLLALREVIWQWFDHVGYSSCHFGVFEHGFRITVSANGKELQPHIILLSPSLWASLFSRAGVYESILICLRIVAELIWRYDGEEKKESELLIQEMFRVSTFKNRLVPQDNDLLLMQHEGNLLRVQGQRSPKKKKSFKTYMFKYKPRLSKVGAWPEVQQFNVQRAYIYVTRQEVGIAQSRDNGRLWSGWYVRSVKVMQQRQRSKMAKSWMFKYKKNVHILSLANVAVSGFQQGRRDQHDHHSCVRWVLAIQACGQACFQGESIDRSLLLTWTRIKEERLW